LYRQNQPIEIFVKRLIFLFLPLSVLSQNITGKVYDNETTVKGIDIFNISKRTHTFTDGNGNFKIEASVNDTLSFHSTFHNPKTIIVKQQDLEEVIVVELKKTINKLKEILLQNRIESIDFDDTKEEQKIKKNITEDSKVNPHLYETSSEYGLDVIRLAGLLGKLFKSNKVKDTPKKLIQAKTLDSLFQKDVFFNKTMLSKDLKIPPKYEQLFFDYSELEGIDKTLLSQDNKLLLLERLVILSDAYLKNIKE
jgi:hypothetical protein